MLRNCAKNMRKLASAVTQGFVLNEHWIQNLARTKLHICDAPFRLSVGETPSEPIYLH
jgi:hypothetical protein